MGETRFQITFDQYDALVEKFETLTALAYYPSLENLDLMKKDPGKYLLFACYISECAHKPKTKEESYQKKNLDRFIKEHLTIVEEESEVINPIPLNFDKREETIG